MNLEDLYRILRTGHVQAQGIVDTVPVPLLVLDSALCIQRANRAFFRTFKVERYETIGKHIYDLGDGQWDIPELRLLLTDVIPKTRAIVDYKVEHDFPGVGSRTMLVTAHTVFSPDDVSTTMLLSFVDATESTHREAEFEVRFGELRHRMKNLLGLVRALANQTKAEGVSGKEYRDAFLGRLTAIIDANEQGFIGGGDGNLEKLVVRTLEPFAASPDAIMVDPGPPVHLDPKQLMSLGLALHELATNALKYGALSKASGQVHVRWVVEEAGGRLLRLTWSESGGPGVSPPVSTGYGSQLIQFAVAYDLGGKVEPTYARTGFKVEMAIPLTGTRQQRLKAGGKDGPDRGR
ncbi:PAS domain-containing protein [Mesorhizobium sp. M1A.F.Ca.ET.072.01.1.1]|nr:HWE histidine kinase domain-containing protein [Mesorhizobium sp. M1A.F.Ca.ET.072.01.1.1]RUW51982.1 PAS domain-containing protein [Mesorhizobium sp. M1A.F.Ca.ET.072.01.1.1]TIV03871.1 MAG: PAS domain-containing protein [Mesorhizobium sp.]